MYSLEDYGAMVGDPVRMEFRKVQEDGESGVICYGYKFVGAGG